MVINQIEIVLDNETKFFIFGVKSPFSSDATLYKYFNENSSLLTMLLTIISES